MTQTVLDLKSSVDAELLYTPGLDSTDIHVTVTDGIATLSGAVPTYPQVVLAVKAAQRVHGITAVAEAIVVVNHAAAAVLDADLDREAGEALARAIDVPDGVTATVADGVVTLNGEVEWQHERDNAGRSVRYLAGVRKLHNHIEIRPTVTAKGLNSAIRESLQRSAQLRGREISVTTDRLGNVTLTGTVHSWADRRQAEHVCWSAPGITSVTNELRLQY